MGPRRRAAAPLLLVALAAIASLLVAACSSGGEVVTPTTAGTAPPGTEPVATTVVAVPDGDLVFDASVQKYLQLVGCYGGALDGKIGPMTDAALVDFQKAVDLTADGELGPATSSALRDAVRSGRQVCGVPPPPTTAAPTTEAPPTTPLVASGRAPCTAAAIQALLGTATINSYVCLDGWAGGTASGLYPGDPPFLLRSEEGRWVPTDPGACAAAGADIPAQVRFVGCPGQPAP